MILFAQSASALLAPEQRAAGERLELVAPYVLHIRPCDCTQGTVVLCRHGAGCDCPGREAPCENCSGTGEIITDECVCRACVCAWMSLQKGPSLQ